MQRLYSLNCKLALRCLPLHECMGQGFCWVILNYYRIKIAHDNTHQWINVVHLFFCLYTFIYHYIIQLFVYYTHSQTQIKMYIHTQYLRILPLKHLLSTEDPIYKHLLFQYGNFANSQLQMATFHKHFNITAVLKPVHCSYVRTSLYTKSIGTIDAMTRNE